MRSYIPLIVAALALLLAGGLYAVAYRTLLADVQKSADLRSQVASKSQQLAQIDAARAALIESDEAALRGYFLSKEDIVPFLEDLQATAQPLHATMDVLSVTDDKTPGHPRVSLALSIAGTFDAVARTVGAIEYAPYDGVVTSLTLDTPGKGAWTAAATYSVGVASTTAPKP